MNKVPVFGTIGSAYAFTFGNLATIAGLIWLPMALLLVGQYYATSHYLNGLASALADGNIYELSRADGLRYLVFFVALLLQAILVTPVMRQALELRQGGALVSFDLGPTSWRVFGATAAFMIVFIVIEYLALAALLAFLLAFALAIRAIGPIDGISVGIIVGFTAFGAVVLFVAALSYCGVRLSFFLVAVAAAERKIDLIRSWRLFDRNFVRVSLVLLAISLPLLILHVALLWAALGFPLFHMPQPNYFTPFRGAPTRLFTMIIGIVTDKMPYFFGVEFLVAPLWVGLSTGAAAAAYRALVWTQKADMRGAANAPVALEAPPV